MQNKLLSIALFFYSLLSFSQIAQADVQAGPMIVCNYDSADAYSRIGMDYESGLQLSESRLASTLSTVFQINYSGNPPQALQDAFQLAANIWEDEIVSSVPIIIDVNYSQIQDHSILGSAGSTRILRNFDGATYENTWYPVALANAITGIDLSPNYSDITINLANRSDWYFGLDGNTPQGMYDLITVALHEIGHGLGMTSFRSYNSDNGIGTFNHEGSPSVFARFIEDYNGVDLVNMSDGSQEVGSLFTSNNAFLNASSAIAALNNERPKIHAPSNFLAGSSIAHLDESMFSAGNQNSLMTPFLNSSESNFNIGDVTRGVFKEMGWSFSTEVLTPSDFVLRINTGGSETDYNEKSFITDNYFDTGVTLNRPQTGLPEPFQTFRFSRSQEMSYDIPLEDGEYKVNLYFAELWFGATGGGSGGVGSRVFDVTIEDQLAEDNLDVFAQVGADAMLVRSHTVTVSGGVLNINFDSRDAVGGERHPIINAIEILENVTDPDERPFVTTWKTDNPGTSDDNQITIPTFPGETYNYNVEWGDGTSDSGVSGDITHTYLSEGTYEVSISGDFPGVRFESQNSDKEKIIFIVQWGAINWQRMDASYWGCSNLDVIATDLPDLSGVSNLNGTFTNCSSLLGNDSFKDWDLEGIIEIENLFAGASLFNQPIGQWNVSNIIDMTGTFSGATSFNQDISDWQVGKVEEMWDMFGRATSFNQDISDWDVSSIIDMKGMFLFADSFDQELGDWKLNSAIELLGMFSNSGLSTENYDATLIGWSTNSLLKNGVDFGADGVAFCQGEAARQKLIDDFGWVITDGGKSADCADTSTFVTTWKTDNPGASQDNQITIPASSSFGINFNYSIEWGDGSSNTGVTEDITHTYDTPGTYQISISGDFPSIYFYNSGDKAKILTVEQWGSIKWTRLSNAFRGCENLDVVAIDVPDLSGINDLDGMFHSCVNLVGNTSFENWDVSYAFSLSNMFHDATQFNQDIGSWDVQYIQFYFQMFKGATSFNQNLADWYINSVLSMTDMFLNSNLSQQNYDDMLVAWAEIEDLSPAVSFHAGSATYCLGQEARQKLIDDFGWSITDGGKAAGCTNQNDFALRINTGGSEVIWSGETFITDQYRTGGAVYTVDFPINETTNDELYQTEIYGPAAGPFTYQIPLSVSGEYNIRLHFAELYFGVQSGGLGSRVFNVSIEGNEVLTNFDILNEVAPATALIKEFNNIEVSDGFVTIEFIGVTQRAKISGIEILGLDTNEPEVPMLALIGEAVINLELGDTYLELGATATDGSGSDISSAIVIGGDVVNTSIVGTYFVSYNVTDDQGTSAEPLFRTVNISEGSLENPADADVNLALVSDAVLSGNSGVRGTLEAILYDPVTDNYFSPTAYNEYGAGFRENLGRPDADNGFVWRVDWSSTKRINYITFGGVYPNQPQPNAAWRISYLNNGSWTVIEEGKGGWIDSGIFEWGGSSQQPISADAIRVQIYSDGTNDLISIHLRGRGGISTSNNDSGTATKATLIQYLPSEASFPFVTTWKTDNPGASDDNQITFPGFSGDEPYIIDWGDGIIDTDVNEQITHTYDVPGTYTISVSGGLNRFSFGQFGDFEKILSIENWDVSNVTDMTVMFDRAESFNQPIGDWDVSNVISLWAAFSEASSFNQSIGDWDVSNVRDMTGTFSGASSFNQDIGGWNVSQVEYMYNLFDKAYDFNQNLGGWNLSTAKQLVSMFNNSGMSTDNYDATLIGWSSNSSLQRDVRFGAQGITYCLGEDARQILIDDFGWIIDDAGKAADCIDTTSFITTWKTDNPGASDDNQITIPTSASYLDYTYDYTVNWGDGSSDEGLTGNITHTYDEPGTYEVKINGDFPHLDFGSGGDNNKIILVNQWGDIEWSSMLSSFWYCPLLNLVAEDVPDLTNVASLTNMFAGCTSLVGNSRMEQWDTSTITEMSSTFVGASQFNINIGSWDVSNVTFMAGMLGGASTFNQDIGGWNVAKVEDMQAMFRSAIAFNQDISSWNVGNVTNMSRMLSYTYSFNQDISDWDVSKVEIMDGLFEYATSFDQDLGSWNVSSVTDMSEMFIGATLLTENYDALLNGWSILELQSGLTFHGGNSEYCQGEAARQKLIDDFGWSITDGGIAEDCIDTTSFVTTWKTDNPGTSDDNQITIPTYPGETYNYSVDWGDGISDSGITSDITHTYAIAGTYEVSISGDFPRIYFDGLREATKDAQKLISIVNWGSQEWSSMEGAFSGCNNLDVLATDIPDFFELTSLRSMFSFCVSLNGNQSFTEWDVSGVTEMQHLFEGATMFNQSIDNWDVSNVTNMFAMFNFATSFNQDLNNWNVTNVSYMGFLFRNAYNFNGSIVDWDVSNVIDMNAMFDGASSFNQDIGNWNVANSQRMFAMFQGALSFNQDIGNWNVDEVINMAAMFSGAYTFNQNISNWNVSKVTEMFSMFRNAFSFNQDLGNWEVGSVENMDSMFSNTALVTENYDKILNGWSIQQLQNGVIFGAGNIQYCLGEAARQKLIDDFGWTITDAGKAVDCIEPLELSITDITYVEGDLVSQLLTDGTRIELGFPGEFSSDGTYRIEPSYEGNVESIQYELTGPQEFISQSSNIAPFNFNGEHSLNVGFYLLTATPYTTYNGEVVSGESLTVFFEVYSLICEEFIYNTFLEVTPSNCTSNGSVTISGPNSISENYLLYEYDENWGNRNILFEYDLLNLPSGNYEIFPEFGYECLDGLRFEIEYNCIVPNDFALRINTGGTETIYNDNVFVTDTYFNTGNVLDRPQTGLPEPFQTFRFSRSQEMSYDIPIEDGEYTVNLYFAELWFGATSGGAGGVGSRVFDVNIEGQLAEDNLDIYAEVGADAMLMKSHTVTVTGGVLDIDFDSRDLVGGERHPVINAIEIISSTTSNDFVVSSLSARAIEVNESILSPNPVINTTSLSFDKPVDLTSIQVYDITGRLMHSYNGFEIKDQGAYILNVTNLPAGSYFLRSQDTNGKSHHQQLIIKR